VSHASRLANDRRSFLRFLAASPLFAAGTGPVLAQTDNFGRDLYAAELIARAQDALNVFDFERVAQQKFRPGHYTYMAMGTDDGGTLRANLAGYDKFQIRVRRLVNTSNIDTSIELGGVRHPFPVMLCPVGHQAAFHSDAELATARAAKSRDATMMLSAVTSSHIKAVTAERGRPVWSQLYADSNWDTTRGVVERIEDSGCPLMAVTVDLPLSNREAELRHRRASNPTCQECHAPDAGIIPPKPMYDGFERASPSDRTFLDWDYIERLRGVTSMQLMLKGIVTAEDARLAVENGIDGVIVSNHGGRAENSGRSTIEALPEVVEAVGGRIPVIFDGGIRRGVDIFKALALGADIVGIGRPYIWGLGTFGQEGVEVVLDILKRELEIIMSQAGAARISDINRDHIALA